MSPATTRPVPAAIGPYRILAELGRGGMAFVYLAARKQAGFTKLLVVKILREDLQGEADFVAMFLNEARVAAQLGHPNVIQTYEVGEHEGRPFIAMEYLEGEALSRVVSRAGPAGVPLGVHLRVLTDMLSGLHYAHQLVGLDGQALGLVHRDVSPHNVLVSQGGVSKVLDFGIAKVIDTALTREGVIKGKIGYMAPEQLAGLPVDRRADVFAAGVMLWEAVAGRKMVERASVEAAVVHRRSTGDEPRLTEVRPDAPPALVAICEKAMAVRPEDRFATAAEMRDAIEAYARAHAPADVREVGDLVERTFREERATLRKVVEERLRSDEPPPAPTEPSAPSLSLGQMTVSTPNPAPAVTPSIAPTLVRRSPLVTGALVAGALALGVGAVAYVAWSRDGGRASAASAAASHPPPGAATVLVAFSVTPAEASLSLDGHAIANPSQVQLPRDGAPHHVVATADGYRTDARTVVLDSDEPVAIALVPLVASAAASSPAASALGAEAGPAARGPGGAPLQELDPRAPRKKRSIYTEDPYQ